MKEFDFSPDVKYSIMESQQDQEMQGINMICAVKHHNAGKLNSHLFFFKGFCQFLQPKYVVLLDIGTEPRKGAINQSVTYLENNLNVGGVCGTVDVEVKKVCYKNCMEGFVRYSQYYEYKISNYLDKAAENLFGFISVLPGAFSVYRLHAIEGTPLKAYFKGLEDRTNTPFQSNMYLAQDRIMCLEIISKATQKNTLAYLPQARAVTDCPHTLDVLLKQRRRWINGATFAQFYVLTHFMRICRTKHNCCRKIWITIFYLYYLMNSLLSFLVVGVLYFCYSIVVRDFFSTNGFDFTVNNPEATEHGNTPLVILFEVLYLLLLFQTLLLSLSVNIRTAKCQIYCISIVFGILMLFFVVLAYFYFFFSFSEVTDISQDTDAPSYAFKVIVAVSIGIVILSQTLPVMLHCHCNPCKVIVGFLAYIFMAPTYINMFTIYSYCNTHDVSWGTRGRSDKFYQTLDPKEKRRVESFMKFRYNLLIAWILINMLASYGLTQLVRRGVDEFVLVAFSLFLAFTLIFRLLAAILSFVTCSCECRRKKGIASVGNTSQAQMVENQSFQNEEGGRSN